MGERENGSKAGPNSELMGTSWTERLNGSVPVHAEREIQVNYPN